MSEKLSKKQVRLYVEVDDGVTCPYCDSPSIESGTICTQVRCRIYREMRCLKCNCTWVEGYTLDSIGCGDGSNTEFQYPEADRIGSGD